MRSLVGFDAVAQREVGARVVGAGVVEGLAELSDGGGVAWRGQWVEPDVQGARRHWWFRRNTVPAGPFRPGRRRSFGRVGHHPVRVVAGGAVAVVGVEVEVDAGVAVVFSWRQRDPIRWRISAGVRSARV